LDSFLTFINQQPDIKEQASLLAVSGGVDSVVLVSLFHKMGFKAGIAHCNFGLRGEESENDEEFVRTLAASCGFDFFSTRFDTKVLAKEKAISTQMAARDLRYKWFEEIRQSNAYTWIATAHHANDSFETVLLNLVRGSGLPGLHGIPGVNKQLIRPLIYATKEEILKYARENSLEWREDRSNDSDDYKRNLVRHKITPIVRQLNPSFEATFKRSSERLMAANNLLEEYLQAWRDEVVSTERDLTRIAISRILSASEPKYRLYFILQNYGYTYHQVSSIFESLLGPSGKIFESDSYTLLIDRDDVVIRRTGLSEAHEDWKIENLTGSFRYEDRLFSFQLVDSLDTTEAQKKEIAYFDSTLLIFPLVVRGWRVGDTFQPFGMKGKKKKVSDIFIDQKLDRFEKEKVRLLINGNGDILWVIGVRSDERYKVRQESEEILMVSVNPAHS
jgi:tRNA(Ile)-lysidine synthase